jgi:hypothetical protein
MMQRFDDTLYTPETARSSKRPSEIKPSRAGSAFQSIAALHEPHHSISEALWSPWWPCNESVELMPGCSDEFRGLYDAQVFWKGIG